MEHLSSEGQVVRLVCGRVVNLELNFYDRRSTIVVGYPCRATSSQYVTKVPVY